MYLVNPYALRYDSNIAIGHSTARITKWMEEILVKNMAKTIITVILTAGLLAACGDNEEGTTSFFAENDWPELDVVEEEIGSDFETVNVENNEGNSRVIVYENNGSPEYKSIYISDEERLKIISIGEDGEGQVYNDVIR